MTTTADADERPASDGPLPARDKEAFNCPRCGAYAHQAWNSFRTSEDVTRPDPQAPGGVGKHHTWKQSVCQRCTLPSFWRNDQLVYPQARVGGPAHPDMPAEVRELYDEAATVAAVSRRAGAALARATVERLIKVLDPEAPKNAPLDKRIDRIRERVSTPLGEMLEVVRYLGNKMLHVEDQPGELVVVTLDDEAGPAVLELLLEAANDLVDELVTRPKTVAGLRDRLPEGVRRKLGLATDDSVTVP